MARRRRGTWLPTLGSAGLLAEQTVPGRQINTIPVATGFINTLILELTTDEPQDDEGVSPAPSMADVVGSEYILRRIVGKMYLHRDGTDVSGAGIDFGPAVHVAAGFFVARAADATGPAGVSLPIGAESASTGTVLRDNYSPLESDTIREPWIWRRHWILGLAGGLRAGGAAATTPTHGSGTTHGNYVASYPCSTALYGSVADGPHIDAQSARRVGRDERLWCAISVCPAPITDTVTDGTLTVRGYLDYRLFGSIVRAANRASF